MKPNKTVYHDPQDDLFKTELSGIININHPLVCLGRGVDWEKLEEVFLAQAIAKTTVARQHVPVCW